MMNREIKFRAWDKVNNKMVLDCGKYNHYWFGGNYRKDVSFMQYTGLKDKNGNEIYEGDILSTGLDSEGAIKNVYVSGFDYGEYKFSATTEFYTTSWREVGLLKSVKVIGNIYENPELLEGKL